jgi:hypothetical protein
MRPLREIAREIEATWKNMYFGAVPYIEAMALLDTIDDMYYCDSGRSIVIYSWPMRRTGVARMPSASRLN